MTQEERKYLSKVKLWLILHPNKGLRGIEDCEEYCLYNKTKCPEKVIMVNNDFSECAMIDRKDLAWVCFEFVRGNPK